MSDGKRRQRGAEAPPVPPKEEPPAATAAHAAHAAAIPSSIKVSAIRDEAIRALFERETAIRNELGGMRNELRELQDKKDANLRKNQPAAEKARMTFDRDWDVMQKQKSDLHAQMDQLRIQQNTLSQARDTLRMIDFESAPLAKEVTEFETRLAESKRTMEKLEQQRTAVMASLPFRSAGEADAEIARIERDIAAATKSNNATLASALGKRKAAAEKGKREVIASYNIDDKLLAEKKRCQQTEQNLAKKKEQLADIAEKKKALREKLGHSAVVGDQFGALKSELHGLSKRMDELQAQRREKKPANTEVAVLSDQLTKLREHRDTLGKELDEIRAKLIPVTFDVDPEYRGDLIGKNGATIEQLQTDFGVAIAVDGGRVVVVGASPDCAAAVEAMKSIISGLETNRQRKTLKFDVALAKSFIGAKGANIDKMQAASGAQIKLDTKEGVITLIGTKEAIDTATALIDEFVDSSSSETILYDSSLRDFVIGKGGETVRRIEQESGVKRIRIDRDTNTITIMGHRENVDKAKAAYTELIQGMTQNAFTMRCDDRMARVVIGAGGKTIREIQDTTKAVINVNNGQISIRGGKEAVAAARAMIEDITRRDETKVAYDPHMFSLLVTRPLVVMEPDEDGKKQQDAEGNCPLEDIKINSGCDQVSAIRSESKVVLRGKKECVAKARMLLEDFLRKNRPDVFKVAIPEVIGFSLARRPTTASVGERQNYFDKLRLKYAGVTSVEFDREHSTVEIAGGKAEIKAAADELQEHVAQCQKFVATIHVHHGAFGTILGSGGKTINDLQRKYKTEIHLDRVNSAVVVFSPAFDEESLAAIVKDIEGLAQKK